VHKRAVRGERGVPAQHAISNHKTNIGLPDAGHRRLNRRGEEGEPFSGSHSPAPVGNWALSFFTY
jgi:hypothetical protein